MKTTAKFLLFTLAAVLLFCTSLNYLVMVKKNFVLQKVIYQTRGQLRELTQEKQNLLQELEKERADSAKKLLALEKEKEGLAEKVEKLAAENEKLISRLQSLGEQKQAIKEFKSQIQKVGIEVLKKTDSQNTALGNRGFLFKKEPIAQ